MTIATRFTADQLAISPDHANSDKAKRIAAACIEFCKLLQAAYPNARFAVDGKSNNPSNLIDYRGRVDVYVTVDGKRAGTIDVDDNAHWRTDSLRYNFEGPYVDKGDSRRYGEGHVWRKDPAKLVAVIQEQNCLRDKNPQEQYEAGRQTLQRNAAARLSNIEGHARRLLDLSDDEAIALALGKAPSSELTELSKAANQFWKDIVAGAQADLDQQNAELAAQLGVTPWAIHATNYCANLAKVLRELDK